MMEYMRNGGFPMWAMLITAIGVAIYGATRPKADRPGVFLAGILVSVMHGILGMATGMEAVAAGIESRPHENAGELVAMGLGELANNGTFSIGLAILFGLACLVTRAQARAGA